VSASLAAALASVGIAASLSIELVRARPALRRERALTAELNRLRRARRAAGLARLEQDAVGRRGVGAAAALLLATGRLAPTEGWGTLREGIRGEGIEGAGTDAAGGASGADGSRGGIGGGGGDGPSGRSRAPPPPPPLRPTPLPRAFSGGEPGSSGYPRGFAVTVGIGATATTVEPGPVTTTMGAAAAAPGLAPPGGNAASVAVALAAVAAAPSPPGIPAGPRRHRSPTAAAAAASAVADAASRRFLLSAARRLSEVARARGAGAAANPGVAASSPGHPPPSPAGPLGPSDRASPEGHPSSSPSAAASAAALHAWIARGLARLAPQPDCDPATYAALHVQLGESCLVVVAVVAGPARPSSLQSPAVVVPSSTFLVPCRSSSIFLLPCLPRSTIYTMSIYPSLVRPSDPSSS